MSLPAGPGNTKPLCCALCGLVAALATAAEPEQAGWMLLAEASVPPGTSVLALVRQNGIDIKVAIAEPGATLQLHVQDGPEERHGSEVLVLSNEAGDQPRRYQLLYAPTGAAGNPLPGVELISAPTPAALQQAQQMMTAAALWAEPDRKESALQAFRQTAADATSALQQPATIAWLHGLLALDRHQEVLDHFSAQGFERGTGDFHAYYLTWLRARALQTSGNGEAALELLRYLADQRGTLDPESAVQQITLSTILGELGQALVVGGFDTSNVNRMQPGMALIDEALLLAAPYEDPALAGNLTATLALAQAMGGDWDTGLNSLLVAEQLLEQAQSLLPLVVARSNIGFHYLRRGQYQQAQNHYRSALQLLESQPDINLRQYSTTYARLARTYRQTGDYRKAEDYFRIAIRLYEETSAGERQQEALLELGEVQRLRGALAEALQTHLALDADIAAADWNDGWVRLHIQLARDYLALGQYAQAREQVGLLTRHRSAQQEKGELVSRIPAYALDLVAVVAESALRDGNPGAASAELEAALETLQTDVQEPDIQLGLLQLLISAYQESGRNDEAINTGRQALALIETTRAQIDIHRDGATWNNQINSTTTQVVNVLLERYLATGDPELFAEAFSTIQHTRAINLRQSQQLARSNVEPAQTRADLQLLWQQMIDAKRALLAASVRNQDTAAAETAAIRAEEAWKTYRPEAAGQDLPALAFISLDELQPALGNSTALLFNIGDEHGYGIAITAGGWQVFQVPGSQALAPLVAGSLAELASRSEGGDFGQARQLARTLLEPLQQQPEKLLVEADGVLGLVPFAALPVLQEATYIPLVMHSAVTSVPSLSAYFSRQSPTADPGVRLQAAIMADPDFGTVEAPFELVSADTGLFEQWRNGLDRLPYTAVEAEQLGARFAGQPIRILLGAEASSVNLFAPEVRNAKLLHLASHGFSSTTNPDQIGFLLAGGGESGVSGFLTQEELEAYRFNTELVVISGCETGLGEVIPGEHMLGLSRTFLAQGAKTVLATLWPVSDRATAVFMDYFYEALVTTRLSTDAALQQAQARMFGHPTFRHPLYWAGFVLTSTSAASRPL